MMIAALDCSFLQVYINYRDYQFSIQTVFVEITVLLLYQFHNTHVGTNVPSINYTSPWIDKTNTDSIIYKHLYIKSKFSEYEYVGR